MNEQNIEQLIAANERLGQELDRWQLIARDLIGELTIKQVEQPWISDIDDELNDMPEISPRPVHRTCGNLVSYENVSAGYFAACQYCDADLYRFETRG
jgi:hypothetical protein